MTKQRTFSGKRRHWAYMQPDPDNIVGKALKSLAADPSANTRGNLVQSLFSEFKQNLKVHQNLCT
jgi:hypothetical protein